MNEDEFQKLLEMEARQISVMLSKEQLHQFYLYSMLLLEWNQKMNLTTIVKPEEIITKHFVDSLTIHPFVPKGSYVADVGTGAGFPGIPLGIIRRDCTIVLMDSLQKRVNFLQEVISKLKLTHITAIHTRAEEAGNNELYREKFDIVTARAVASMNTLLEYLLPLCKKEGNVICMKGNNIAEEMEKSKKALEVLKGRVKKQDTFCLPQSDYQRSIIIIEKTGSTPNNYPRMQGKPSKDPIC